jgi:hypothetical protein
MSEMPNIKIQRQGAEMPCKRKWLLPAADLERYTTMLEVGVAARPGQSPHQHPHPA